MVPDYMSMISLIWREEKENVALEGHPAGQRPCQPATGALLGHFLGKLSSLYVLTLDSNHCGRYNVSLWSVDLKFRF